MIGVVDFLCDPNTLTTVDDVWAAGAADMRIQLVRAPITLSADGHLPTPLYRQAAQAWQRAGVQVDAVLATEFLPSWTDDRGTIHWPNEPVGTGTHMLTSPYIERFRLTAQGMAQQLHGSGITGWTVGNEFQVSVLQPGQNCPPTPRYNRSSLAPEVAAALLWQTSSSLRHVGATRIIAGALSVLAGKTGLDAANPYLLGWLGKLYAHLAACGVKPNWTHWGINLYGYLDVAGAQRIYQTLRGFMDAHGDHAELIVTEWGSRNHGADVARLTATGAALYQVFGTALYFQRPGLVPWLSSAESYTEYGLIQWRSVGGVFRVVDHYSLYEPVQQLYATLPTTP